MNWCCGAGGGVSSNERADDLRLTAFQRKKSQLDQIKVDGLVSACSNCRIHIEDGLEALPHGPSGTESDRNARRTPGRLAPRLNNRN